MVSVADFFEYPKVELLEVLHDETKKYVADRRSMVLIVINWRINGEWILKGTIFRNDLKSIPDFFLFDFWFLCNNLSSGLAGEKVKAYRK